MDNILFWTGILLGGVILLAIVIVVLMIVKQLIPSRGAAPVIPAVPPGAPAAPGAVPVVPPGAPVAPAAGAAAPPPVPVVAVAPAAVPAAAAAVVAAAAAPRRRGILFWFLLILSVICIGMAMVGISKIQAGVVQARGVKLSHLALAGGSILTIMSAMWFSNSRPSWVTRLFGVVTAIFAVILLALASWDLFLRTWWLDTITKMKKAKGMDINIPMGWVEEVTLFVELNWAPLLITLGILLAIAALISLVFSQEGRVFLGKAIVWVASLALIAGIAGWFWNSVTRANKPARIVVTTEGLNPIEVSSKEFVEIRYPRARLPEGYKWRRSIHGSKGIGDRRNVALYCMKAGTGIAKTFGPEDPPELPGLPQGNGPLLVKITKLPGDIQEITCNLTVNIQLIKD